MKLAEKLPSYEELQDLVIEQARQIEFLTTQLLQLKRHVFGKRSEQFTNDSQGVLFTEALPELKPEPKEIEVKSHKRNGRMNLPKELPIIRKEFEPAQQTCTNCNQPLAKIGEEVTKQLEYIPASCFQNHLVRIKRACSCCKEAVFIGEIPEDAQVFDRCKAGPGLISHIMVSKHCDHLPLNRQEQMFSRLGIEISRKSMCDWVNKSAELLEPVVEVMREQILESNKIHADESSILVQKEDGYKNGYLWGMLANKQVVFQYSPSRDKGTAIKLFGNYQGFIQADGYQGYNSLFELEKATRVACWAHVRRKFFDLEKTNPEQRKIMLLLIKKLYRLERRAKEKDKNIDYESIRLLRQEQSLPIVQEIKQYLELWSRTALPKSPLGQAVAYSLNQWSALIVFLEHGFLELDNNAIEREIRPIAVGRKNWLFAGSPRGAKNAATIFSILNSCRMNSINPFKYLCDILPKLSNLKNNELSKITPANWKQN